MTIQEAAANVVSERLYSILARMESHMNHARSAMESCDYEVAATILGQCTPMDETTRILAIEATPEHLKNP